MVRTSVPFLDETAVGFVVTREGTAFCKQGDAFIHAQYLVGSKNRMIGIIRVGPGYGRMEKLTGYPRKA